MPDFEGGFGGIYGECGFWVAWTSWHIRTFFCTPLYTTQMPSQEEVLVLKYALMSMITMLAGSVATLEMGFAYEADPCLQRPLVGGLTLQHQLWLSAATVVIGWLFVSERLCGFRRKGGQTLRVFFILWTLLGFGMWIAVSLSTPCFEMVSSYLIISFMMKLTIVCIV